MSKDYDSRYLHDLRRGRELTLGLPAPGLDTAEVEARSAGLMAVWVNAPEEDRAYVEESERALDETLALLDQVKDLHPGKTIVLRGGVFYADDEPVLILPSSACITSIQATKITGSLQVSNITSISGSVSVAGITGRLSDGEE